MNPSVEVSFWTCIGNGSSATVSQAEADELLVGCLDRPERLDQEVGHLLGLGAAAAVGEVVADRAVGVGLRPVVEQVALEVAAGPSTAGRRSGRRAGGSPGRRCPGTWSSEARPSGRGSRRSGKARTGIVDQRFDHIDSGRFPSTGARA